MSAPDAAAPPAAWRSRAARPQRIRRVRLGLLVFAGALAALVIGWTIVSAMGDAREVASPPLAMTSPRLIGQDNKQRSFVITAARAERQKADAHQVTLQTPALVRNEGQADALHVTAAQGVYDETAGRLRLTGGVDINGPSGSFTAPSIVYDTKSGNLVGGGAIHAQSNFGQLHAGNVAASGQGKSVVYKGGVRARINPR